MPKKDLERLLDKKATCRTLVDKLPINKEGKENLYNLMLVLNEIEEAHRNELHSLRNYVVIGDEILEGSPTQIGFQDRQKVQAIFKVRLLKEATGKFLAYCLGDVACVAEGGTRNEVLRAMKATIRRLLELNNQQVPIPVIMEVSNCAAGGDTWFYDNIKKTQARHEKLGLEFKKAREFAQYLQDKVDNFGISHLTGLEE